MWREVIDRNPSNRDRLLAQDPQEFVPTMERWLLAYCPCGDDVVPGLPTAVADAMDVPALVFRSGERDPFHTRKTSDDLAQALPNAQLTEPPLPDPHPLHTQLRHPPLTSPPP